ncbi:MAG: LysM peptidoglycan-binding domain-containing protein [Prosthecobacter sp.]|nr:LysM peptidoglycan-binding domain-containing protein [Prosthecobacter sp.]
MKLVQPPLASLARCIALIVMGSGMSVSLSGQIVRPVPAGPVKIEPGLETAVTWKWWVAPSKETDWGLLLPKPGEDPAAAVIPGAGPRPNQYEVKRGDALAKISRKFGMTVDQLKAFNSMTSDVIHIGDVLKIPTLLELATIIPPPPPVAPPVATKKGAAKPSPPRVEPAGMVLTSEAKSEMENVLLQVFLDREQFSTGSIDGRGGATFSKVLELYQSTHEEAKDLEALREKAKSTVGNPYATYTLKFEDFRFIAPPKERATDGIKRSGKGKSSAKFVEPPPTYDELTTVSMLAYRSPWEFVAERFHCEEAFLRKLNLKVASAPGVGTEFLVPNVLPFEIEKAFEGTLQPAADPQKPIVAAVVELARLEISQGGKLIAVMPLSVARPDLRGRGSWTILDVIPRPRLATLQELKPTTKSKASGATPTVSPTAPAPPLPPPPVQATRVSEQFLAAGPNNPVGIVWINLAKAKSTEPLAYGLHGTSIPDRMKTQESIGGIRLANWDIARAARMLPAGTPLQWK